MNKIKLLSKQVAELIAAGEVIERPASIVKELVENSMDSGAGKITVEIKGGGIKYIRVTDDGCGIHRDDIDTAFIRHATSKIDTKEDLESILTFGFRGEALPSIAAMCRVEVITRTADTPLGCKYIIAGEQRGTAYDEGCPVGTSIIVRDVFFNTPARLKFLKKDSYEGSNIQAVLERLALINTHISFKFIKDGSVAMNTPGNGDLIVAIHSLLGREFAGDLLEVNYTEGALNINGYITSPKSSKATRAMQCFYINSRYIKSKTCITALEEAFKGQLMSGRFPGCVLNINIPPNTVDVNVHPAKTEVRFSEENAVYNLVYSACKTTLNKNAEVMTIRTHTHSSPKPINQFTLKDFDHKDNQYAFKNGMYNKPVSETIMKIQPNSTTVLQKTPFKNDIIVPQSREITINRLSSNEMSYNTQKKMPEDDLEPLKPNMIAQLLNKSIAPINLENTIENKSTGADSEENFQVITEKDNNTEDIKVIGQIFETYIILEKGSSVIFIDKHAAHERALYNKLKAATDILGQRLLAPITLDLNHVEHSFILDNKDMLQNIGFEIEDFGGSTILIREIPNMLNEEQSREIIIEMANKPLKKDLTPAVLDEIYHSMACRGAVKAGNLTPQMELEFIADLVASDADLSYCPHGRPVMVELTKSKLERMFGRIV